MNYSGIKRYLEGKVTPEEAAQIRNWIVAEENNDELRKILGEIWMNSEISLKGQTPDFETMLDRLHHQINNQMVYQTQSIPFSVKVYQIFSRVAAILILPLFIVSIYFFQVSRENSSGQRAGYYREISTKPGTRTQIELSDGTLVWLNDGTTLRYPEKFSGNKREVFLDGEAYFEVKSDTQHPFWVNNSMMNTRVTGTHFNLNAYSADKYFEATLLEGKINLEKEEKNLVMKPGEQVSFDPDAKKIVQKQVDPSNAKAWVNGKLIFKDEMLEVAAKKLARWYNVEIVLAPDIRGYMLTGTIQDENLIQSLSLIAQALPVKFDYKKKSDDKNNLQPIIYMKKK